MDDFNKYYGDKNIWKSDKEIKNNISLFYKVQKKIFPVECLYPDKKECSGKPIKSHSIQLSRILKKLSDKQNKVMMFNAETNPFSGINIKLKEIGINKATIFLGLCNYHDTQIFKLIETDDMDINNTQKLFLYAYRAVLKNYYLKYQSSERYKFYANSITINDDVIKPLLLALAYSTYVGYFHFGKIKNIFDLSLLNNTFNDQIIHKYRFLDYELPVSVCSAFTPTNNFNGEKINDYNLKTVPNYVMMNVFPENGKTFILLSYLLKQNNYLKNYVKKIIETDDIENKLSEVILRNIENFVVSSEHWSMIPEKRKLCIQDFFAETLYTKGDNVLYNSNIHNLFRA